MFWTHDFKVLCVWCVHFTMCSNNFNEKNNLFSPKHQMEERKEIPFDFKHHHTQPNKHIWVFLYGWMNTGLGWYGPPRGLSNFSMWWPVRWCEKLKKLKTKWKRLRYSFLWNYIYDGFLPSFKKNNFIFENFKRYQIRNFINLLLKKLHI